MRWWLAVCLLAWCCGTSAGWCEEAPSDAPSAYARGLESYQHRQWDEALRWWRQTMTLDPSLAQAYVGVGVILLHQGHAAEAEAEFQTALAHDPRQVDALADLGVLALQRGQYDIAVSYYRKAVGIEPTDASLWVDLATSYAAGGHSDAARTAALNALSFDADADEARALLQRLDRQPAPP